MSAVDAIRARVSALRGVALLLGRGRSSVLTITVREGSKTVRVVIPARRPGGAAVGAALREMLGREEERLEIQLSKAERRNTQ
jgi:hypothetical protein